MLNPDRPISAVLNDIIGNVQEIIRSEMRLAKTELGEEISKARAAGVWLGVGALLLVFSMLFVLLAIVYALSLVLPEWAAALIVALGTGVIAASLVALGLQRFKAVRAAPKTAASLKENVEWAKQLTR